MGVGGRSVKSLHCTTSVKPSLSLWRIRCNRGIQLERNNSALIEKIHLVCLLRYSFIPSSLHPFIIDSSFTAPSSTSYGISPVRSTYRTDSESSCLSFPQDSVLDAHNFPKLPYYNVQPEQTYQIHGPTLQHLAPPSFSHQDLVSLTSCISRRTIKSLGIHHSGQVRGLGPRWLAFKGSCHCQDRRLSVSMSTAR